MKSMRIGLTTGAVLGAILLAGCAGMTADVHAYATPNPLSGALTWRFASVQDEDAAPPRAPYETLLRDVLARHGFTFTNAPDGNASAHYLVSVSYDTRPSEVGVTQAGCDAPNGSLAGHDCRLPSGGGFSSWFHRTYWHSLTVRFFTLPGGEEVYRVSATSRDDSADPHEAMPALVTSAFAQFPYVGADWRVKLRAMTANGAPGVISVKPVTQ